MSSAAAVPGTLRLSKGAWLFKPDAVDVLVRVNPQPAPSMEGFLSRAVVGRLEVVGRACRAGGGAPRLEPRTGVPDRVVGRVVDVSDGVVVVDAGVAVVVNGVSAAIGDDVTVDVDVDAGVGVSLL